MQTWKLKEIKKNQVFSPVTGHTDSFFLYRQVLYFGLLSWVRMCSENGTFDKMCLRDTRKTF